MGAVIANSGQMIGLVALGGGDDTLTNTGSITGAMNLGDGNDRFDFRTTPGSGVIGQGIDPLRLDVNVHGGKGNDWVSGNLGDVFNAQITVRAYFGNGNNNFTISVTQIEPHAESPYYIAPPNRGGE